MTQKQIDRRTFLTVGAVGVAAAAVGMRAVMAQDEDATPGATPDASPAASPAAAGDMIMVTAKDIEFDPKELTIPADTDVQIHVVNEGMLEHDFHIEDTDFKTELLPGSKKAEETITVNLAAGEYVYFCAVPGHREAGMEGTLTVE